MLKFLQWEILIKRSFVSDEKLSVMKNVYVQNENKKYCPSKYWLFGVNSPTSSLRYEVSDSDLIFFTCLRQLCFVSYVWNIKICLKVREFIFWKTRFKQSTLANSIWLSKSYSKTCLNRHLRENYFVRFKQVSALESFTYFCLIWPILSQRIHHFYIWWC